MKKNKIFLALIALTALLAVPIASAAIADSFARAGQILFSFFQQQYVVFIITLVFFFVLLYGIFMAGLSRVPSIGEGRYAKIIGVSLSLISTLGLFFFLMRQGPKAVFQRLLAPIGFIGGIALAFVVFAFFFYSMRSEGQSRWYMAFIASGLALLFWGQMTESGDAMAWGWVLLIIGLIGAFAASFGGHGDAHGHHHPHDPHHGGHYPGAPHYPGGHGHGPHAHHPGGHVPTAGPSFLVNNASALTPAGGGAAVPLGIGTGWTTTGFLIDRNTGNRVTLNTGDQIRIDPRDPAEPFNPASISSNIKLLNTANVIQHIQPIGPPLGAHMNPNGQVDYIFILPAVASVTGGAFAAGQYRIRVRADTL
jgi:hypothetical protein